MRNRLLALPIGLALGACSGTAPGVDATSGAKLSLDYFADTDVIGFRITVTQLTDASCEPGASNTVLSGGKVKSFDVDLVDGLFPGGIEVLDNKPFKNESRHVGADLFVSLPEGCYQVDAVPVADFVSTPEFGDDSDNAVNQFFDEAEFDGFDLNKDSNDGEFTPSEECAAVWGKASVVDGKTSEILLLSQCENDPIGALDTLVLLNHPPEMIVWVDEKFNYECEAVHACALIKDPDDDPIRVEFQKVSGKNGGVVSTELTEPKLVGFSNGSRDWMACATIVTDERDDYSFKFTAWDQGWEHGQRKDIEDIIDRNQGLASGTTESRDSQHFPVYTAFYEQPLCFDDHGNLGPAPGVDIDLEPDCTPASDLDWYYCEDPNAPEGVIESRDYLCDDHWKVIPEALYPACGKDHLPDPKDPGEPEICDGIDNDNDGQVDEGFVVGNVYDWTYFGGGSASAGSIQKTEVEYDEAWGVLRFHTKIAKKWGWLAQGLTVAINDGPNPKGQGNLALLYLDGTNPNDPVITVYAYNGLNSATSFKDGSSASGNQTPDRIASSLVDDSFVIDVDVVRTSEWVTYDFTIDVTGINSHSPLYPINAGWDGMLVGDKLGIWYHTYAGLQTWYNNGYLTEWWRDREGWLDLSWQDTNSEEVCKPDNGK